ncbi:MAG TPA: DUF4142 domain-containing protein [Gemmatimonadales bacterium]|nr:DUF4142 domain-containing protein [Gemmatimonadales bacterium]
MTRLTTIALLPPALVSALLVGTACNSGRNASERQTARSENTVTGGAYDSVYRNERRGDTTGSAAAGRNAANAGSTGTSPAVGKVSAAGRAVGAIDAADRLEIQTARLALQRSNSSAVKQLATTLLRDHQANLKKAEQLAKQAGVNAIPPTEATTRMTAAGDQLKQATGKNFDLAYVQMQIDDHQQNIQSLQAMQGQVENNQVKAFVAQTLPTLQHHLQLAEATKRRLGGSTADTTGGRMRDTTRGAMRDTTSR